LLSIFSIYQVFAFKEKENTEERYVVLSQTCLFDCVKHRI